MFIMYDLGSLWIIITFINNEKKRVTGKMRLSQKRYMTDLIKKI